MPHEQSVTDANQLLDGLHDSLQAGNDDLAEGLLKILLLKVLGQLVTSFPQAITQITGCFVSFQKKIP